MKYDGELARDSHDRLLHDRRQRRLDQAGVEPGRERACLETNPAERESEPEEMLANNRWVALDSGAVNDSALRVDNADGGLLHRDIEANEVLLRHETAPACDRAAIMPRQRSARRPEYPIYAPRVAGSASSTFAGSWVYPSVAPARRSASIARRSARFRVVETTRSGSAPTSSSVLGSTDATATARSPSCCAEQAGSSRVARKLKAIDVIDVLSDLFI